MWASGGSRRPTWAPRLFNGSAAWCGLPQFSGSKRAEMVKMGLPHGITAVVTKDTLKLQTVGKLDSSPLDVYICKTLIFWYIFEDGQSSRWLNAVWQLWDIIIVSVLFVTIIAKSLTRGSLNKSVCVNISPIFAGHLGSCQHCIGACQPNNFTAFRNSDPGGWSRENWVLGEVGRAKRGITR